MKVYRGIRQQGNGRHGGQVTVLEGGAEGGTAPGAAAGGTYDLPAHPELFAGRAPPFDWGRDGPGATHLAAAVLVDLRGGLGEIDTRLLLPFLRRFLARLPADDGFEVAETVFAALFDALQGMARVPGSPGGDGARGAVAGRTAVESPG